MPSKRPSLTEFADHVRKAFGYLAAEYGFAEVNLASAQLPQPFYVLFENATTAVLVEGQSWGTAATTYVGRKGARPGNDFALVPLWTIARLTNPTQEQDLEQPGQLAQVSASAAALRRLAEPALYGEFTVLSAAQAYLLERVRKASRT